MAVAAALVSAGTVFGRYHYAADAIAGWIVAAVVWALRRQLGAYVALRV